MLSHLLREPAWLQIWVAWLILINSASLLFWRRIEARWVLAAWLGNIVFMSALFEISGYNRLLGLSHVIFWTPLLVYLLVRREALRRSRPLYLWATVLAASNAVSLAIDYVDVFRHVIGGRT